MYALYVQIVKLLKLLKMVKYLRTSYIFESLINVMSVMVTSELYTREI